MSGDIQNFNAMLLQEVTQPGRVSIGRAQGEVTAFPSRQ